MARDSDSPPISEIKEPFWKGWKIWKIIAAVLAVLVVVFLVWHFWPSGKPKQPAEGQKPKPEAQAPAVSFKDYRAKMREEVERIQGANSIEEAKRLWSESREDLSGSGIPPTPLDQAYLSVLDREIEAHETSLNDLKRERAGVASGSAPPAEKPRASSEKPRAAKTARAKCCVPVVAPRGCCVALPGGYHRPNTDAPPADPPSSIPSGAAPTGQQNANALPEGYHRPQVN